MSGSVAGLASEMDSTSPAPTESERGLRRLPFELLSYILEFVDDQPYLLYNSMQVSRTWAVASAPLLWKRPLLNCTTAARSVLEILRRSQLHEGQSSDLQPLAFEYHSFVSVLDLRWSGLLAVVGSASGVLSTALQACGPKLKELLLGINSGWILRGVSLSRTCPHLVFVDLGNFDCGPREVEECVPRNARGVTLMDIDINKQFIVDFFTKHTALQSIGFSDSWGSRIFEPRMADEELDVIADAMAGASSLRLRLGGSIPRLREESALLLHTIARRTSKLYELSLEDSMTSNDLVLLTFLKNNPNLRSLCLSSTLLTRISFEGIGKLAPHVEKLCLNNRVRWTVESLATLLPQLKRLRQLQLNATNAVTGDASIRLSAVLASTNKRLSVLEISEPIPDWRSFLGPILIRHGQTLDVLTINPRISLSIVDVQWIVDYCPGLRRLTVVGQSLAGGAMDLANAELTRTDLNGFSFVFGGREIRNVRRLPVEC